MDNTPESIASRMRSLRKRAGFTMEQMAKALGFKGASSYQRYEDPGKLKGGYLPRDFVAGLERALAGKGSPTITASEIWELAGPEFSPRQPDVEGFDVARTMRIPVRGEVAAGQWLETVPFLDDLQLEDWLDGLAVPEAMKPYTYALKVKGPSINRLAPDGTYLVCFDLTSGIEVHHRDVVVVERIRDQGALREVTAKRLIQRGDEIVLAPESDDPAWQAEIVLKDDPYQMDAEIRIVAKVKHVVRPL